MALGSRGGSGGSTTTVMPQQETQLSKAQAAVVKARERDYRKIFFPEIVEELREADLATTDQPTLRRQVEATNRAAEQARGQFTSDIAQRGLEGSGAEVQGLAALSGARQSALSRDFFAAQEAAKGRKERILQLGAGVSPQPTTAAPLASGGSASESRTPGSGILGLF